MKKTLLEKTITTDQAKLFFEYQDPLMPSDKIEHVIKATLCNRFGSKKISFVHISYCEIQNCDGYKMESFSASIPCIRLTLPSPMLSSQYKKIIALIPDLASEYLKKTSLDPDHVYFQALQELAALKA